MYWIRVVMLCGILAVLGCSEGEKVTPPDTGVKERIKTALEGVINMEGAGGSEIGAVMMDLSKLKETNATLADELIKDAETLMATGTSAAARKTLAQEMIDKLEGGGGGGE